MKQVRKRFTIPPDLKRDAEEYAQLDNRTFSELVCEALRQHIRRYPRTQKNGPKTGPKTLEDRIIRLEQIIQPEYPQVPQVTNGEGVRD
jgi:hypothetical protein